MQSHLLCVSGVECVVSRVLFTSKSLLAAGRFEIDSRPRKNANLDHRIFRSRRLWQLRLIPRWWRLQWSIQSIGWATAHHRYSLVKTRLQHSGRPGRRF